MIKAILFDIDGTLLDTSEFIYQSFEYTLAQHNLPMLTRVEIHSHMGKALEEMYVSMAPDHLNHSQLVETHRSFQEQNLHLSTPFLHTLDTLLELKKKGIKMSAVTNRSKRTSLSTLQNAGLDHLFEMVISAEDVTATKPHPEGLQRALKHMKIKPSEALMVGDTLADIEAGRAAGVKTVGTTQGLGKEEVIKHKPDYVIYDISEILKLIDE